MLMAIGCWLLAFGLKLLVFDFCFWLLVSGFRFSAFGFRLPLSGFRFPVFGFWISAFGFQFLVSLFWHLVTKFRLLFLGFGSAFRL